VDRFTGLRTDSFLFKKVSESSLGFTPFSPLKPLQEIRVHNTMKEASSLALRGYPLENLHSGTSDQCQEITIGGSHPLFEIAPQSLCESWA
jgi:hypothetical protein